MEDKSFALEIISLTVSSIFPAALTIFTAAFVLPLTRLRLSISALITGGGTAAVLMNLLPPAAFYLLVPGLIVISASQWRALSSRHDLIFLIETGAFQDALLVREERRFGLDHAMCPIGSLFQFKSRVIRRLIRKRADLVLLRPKKVGAAYVCQCPAELSLARASNPREIEPFKAIVLHYRRPEWTLNLSGPQNEFVMSAGYRIGSAYLMTNVLSHAPGLFGFSSTSLPTLDDWRSLCAYEVLLRTSSGHDFVEIVDELKRLAEDAPEQSNILAYLTLRLKLFENRYGPRAETGDVNNVFELAVYGNLRAVALEFNQHAFDKSFAGSLWAVNLLYTLMAYLSASTLYTHKEYGGPVSKEMSWLVGLMVRFVEVRQENRLFVPIEHYDKTAHDKDEAAIEEFISSLSGGSLTDSLQQFQSIIMGQASPQPSPATDSGGAQRIVELPPGEILEEARRWASIHPELCDHRVQMMIEGVMESAMTRTMALFDQFMGLAFQAAAGAEIQCSAVLPGMTTWLDDMQSVSAIRLRLAGLLRDPTLRMVMTRRLAAEQQFVGLFIRPIKDLMAVPLRGEEAIERHILQSIERALPDRLKSTFSTLRAFPGIDRSSSVFLANTIKIGKPYSFEEVIYCGMLVCLFGDTESSEDSFSRAIDKVEREAIEILRGEKIYDRAAILSVSAELLARWRPETAAAIWLELENAGLPIPTWKGRLWRYRS